MAVFKDLEAGEGSFSVPHGEEEKLNDVAGKTGNKNFLVLAMVFGLGATVSIAGLYYHLYFADHKNKGASSPCGEAAAVEERLAFCGDNCCAPVDDGTDFVEVQAPADHGTDFVEMKAFEGEHHHRRHHRHHRPHHRHHRRRSRTTTTTTTVVTTTKEQGHHRRRHHQVHHHRHHHRRPLDCQEDPMNQEESEGTNAESEERFVRLSC